MGDDLGVYEFEEGSKSFTLGIKEFYSEQICARVP